jgi:hypothetical protein
MSKMKEMQIVIEEVARVALEDAEMSSRIGHELGVDQEELNKIYAYLESLLKGEV